MVTTSFAPSQAGTSNTRLISQESLESSIDYLTLSFKQESVEEMNKSLRALALYLLPAPAINPPPNWASMKHSRNYSQQKRDYERNKEEWRKYRAVMEEHHRLLDLSIRSVNKPFMVCQSKYLTHRFESILPLLGGYSFIDAIGEDGKVSETTMVSVTLRLSGKFFEPLDIQKQIDLLRFIATLPALRISRLDSALDDYTKGEIIPFDKMLEAAKRKQYMGVRKSHDVNNHTEDGKPREGTIYLGARESPNFYRCYWKPDRLRMEREIKGREAQENFNMLLEIAELGVKKFAYHLARLAIGGIDFVDRNSPVTEKREKNLGRCERFDWWQNLVDIIGEGIRLKLAKEVNHVEKTFDWLVRQVIAILVAIMNGLGEDSFNNWLFHQMYMKQDKQSPKHEQITEYLKARNCANAA